VEDDLDFKHLTFEARNVLFEEGEQGEAAYLIREGAVEIRKGIHGDYPLILATRVKGDIIGEMALFDDHPHMATAVAVERTEVLAISRREFRRRVDEMDPAMKGIVILLVKRLRQMADDLMLGKTEVNWANWRRKV
jgi:CRP-like cAMP-binding protein